MQRIVANLILLALPAVFLWWVGTPSGSVYYALLMSRLPSVFGLLLPAMILGTALAAVGSIIMEVLATRLRSSSHSISKRAAHTSHRMMSITEQHPALRQLPELMTVVQVMRDDLEQLRKHHEKIDRRSSLTNFVQNLLFFLLGVVVPILIARFYLK
jgi:hypothetical protein